MIPKINRLPLRFNKKELTDHGTSFHTQFLTAIVVKTNPDLPPRFAVILGKKISNLAVTRNRFRRVILNNLRPFLKDLKPGHDVLLLPKKSILVQDTKTITEALSTLLSQANLFNS